MPSTIPSVSDFYWFPWVNHKLFTRIRKIINTNERKYLTDIKTIMLPKSRKREGGGSNLSKTVWKLFQWFYIIKNRICFGVNWDLLTILSRLCFSSHSDKYGQKKVVRFSTLYQRVGTMLWREFTVRSVKLGEN